jgi:hypothetical protein
MDGVLPFRYLLSARAEWLALRNKHTRNVHYIKVFDEQLILTNHNALFVQFSPL